MLARPFQSHCLPGILAERPDLFDQLRAAPAQGDEADRALVELGELGLGGQRRVEDEQAGLLAGALLPELAEADDLVRLVGL